MSHVVEECDKKHVRSMIYQSFSIACKVERDWLPCSSRSRYLYAFFILSPLLWRISSTAHFMSLQTFKKLITRPSLSASYVTSPCCVHYFSSWLAQESMQVDCWLLRCLKHVRMYVSFTMSRWMCLRHLRDTSFPRWEFAKGSREWMRSTREVDARKLRVFY